MFEHIRLQKDVLKTSRKRLLKEVFKTSPLRQMISGLVAFSLETFMPNQVSLIRPSLKILDKTQARVFSISEFLGKVFLDKNCQNSEPVVTLNETQTRNLTGETQRGREILTINQFQQIMTPFFFLVYSQFSGIQKSNCGGMFDI